MPKTILWKFLLTAFLVLVSIALITPFEDRDFGEYALSQATGDANATLHPDYVTFASVHAALKERLDDIKAEQTAALKEGEELNPSRLNLLYFRAFREFGQENSLDYATYFEPPQGVIGTIASRIAPFLVKPGIRAAHEKDPQDRNDLVLRTLLRQSQTAIRKGLDLRGGIAFTMKLAEKDANATQATGPGQVDPMDKVVEIMNERLNAFGVAETVVRKKGATEIEVQIPGTTTQDEPGMIDDLQRPAELAFHVVSMDDDAPANPTEGETWVNDAGTPFTAMRKNKAEPYEQAVWIESIPRAAGDIVEQAAPRQNQTGGWYVALDFTSDGGEEFADLTGEIANMATGTRIGQLAIVLDGVLESYPTVKKRIGGGAAVIEGTFSAREAKMLSDILNNPLDVSLEIGEKYEVSPTLADDAYESSKRACFLGAVLVIAFMITWYKAGGVVAVLSVATNVLLVVAALAGLFQATFTLPGIAALVLTIGMAVDANILIFERIREELKVGKSSEAALDGGYEKAFSTIIDANVTTLITASILIWLGTGPVKGFGVTLAIGILVSMFCALVVSRFLMQALLRAGVKNLISFKAIEKSEPRAEIDFHKHRKLAFLLSWTIVLVGVGAVYQNKDRILGIDFRGGEELIASYEQLIPSADLEAALADKDLGEVQHVYRSEVGAGEGAKRLVLQTETDKAAAVLETLANAFPDANLQKVGESSIGGSVSAQIQNDAILSVVVALLGILLYVAVRFEVGYAIGAVVATVHDVLMTVGLFALIGHLSGGTICSGQFTAPMLASILMIVGYSINDTIVVFDRIREELLMNPVTNLRKIILVAINRVLSRSILTSVTTLMASLSLWIFGAGVINDFAFVFVIGILTGTFSSIFIASPVFYWWHKGDRKHVEEREILPKYDWQITSKNAG